MQDATVAVQGFGNVGSYAALLAHQQGARIIAVSDASGAVACANGLDIPRLFADYAVPRRPLADYQADGVIQLAQEELLTADVDILIPAALGEVLTEDVAKELRARMVVEAANAPTMPTADAVLAQRGIPVFPDILANAGGVTVSYFEWAQNIQCFRWTEQEVNQRLERVMLDSYRTVRTVVERRKLSWRMAAYVVALGRVAKATVLRGV
jgi:glutamate dehydrogenase (NAD(P)+)